IEPWKTAGNLLDERWFVEVDIQDARERIVKRHVETGVTSTTELAIQRAEANDFPNGEFVIANMLPPTRQFKSIHDTSIAI
ncbi:14125_t:CDS:2, partial [Acaulospora colombiana]